MKKIYIINFDGQLRGKVTGTFYKWTRKQPFEADSRDMSVLNERTYRTRPVVETQAGPVATTQARVTVNVPLEIVKRGGWYTLLKGGIKVFSSRDEDEVKAKKAEYDTK